MRSSLAEQLKTRTGLVDGVLVVALVIGVALRVGWLSEESDLISDAAKFYELASSLADGDGYEEEGRPTAFRPPGYPAALGGLFAVFGKHVLAGELLNTLASIAIIALTYGLGRRLYGLSVARLAAIVVALTPSLIIFNGILISETIFTALQLAIVTLVIAALGTPQRKQPDTTPLQEAAVPEVYPLVLGPWFLASLTGVEDALILTVVLAAGLLVATAILRQTGLAVWIAAGVLTGLAMLVRPAALVIVPAVFLAIWLAHREQAGRAAGVDRVRLDLRPAAVFVVAVVVVVTPWMVRNWVVIGTGATLATNAGYNLLAGNNTDADGCLSIKHPDTRDVRRIPDEAERERETVKAVFNFVRDEPEEALVLIPRKFACMWSTGQEENWVEKHQADRWWPMSSSSVVWLANGFYYALVGTALLGIRAWWRGEPRHVFMASIVVLTALYYLVFFGSSRFHAPLMPFFAIWAGCALIAGWSRLRTAGSARP